MEDAAKVHYLSEMKCTVTPLHILEGRRRIEELILQMESQQKFYDNLAKNGLMEVYLETRFGKKSKSSYKPTISKPIGYGLIGFFVGLFT